MIARNSIVKISRVFLEREERSDDDSVNHAGFTVDNVKANHVVNVR